MIEKIIEPSAKLFGRFLSKRKNMNNKQKLALKKKYPKEFAYLNELGRGNTQKAKKIRENLLEISEAKLTPGQVAFNDFLFLIENSHHIVIRNNIPVLCEVISGILRNVKMPFVGETLNTYTFSADIESDEYRFAKTYFDVKRSSAGSNFQGKKILLEKGEITRAKNPNGGFRTFRVVSSSVD